MATPAVDNTFGALIFYAYMVAALSLTGLIGQDLINKYTSLQKRSASKSVKKSKSDQPQQDTGLQLTILSCLSFLSFIVLSYHMLSFLIQSYQDWSTSQPSVILSPSSIWNWSVQSQLFRDFGEVICNDRHRWWWTQLALLYSLGWNVYMAIEGVRRYILHLWAYFLLDQILPVSFTQNLFLLAMNLQGGRTQAPLLNLDSKMSIYLSSLVCLYVGILASAPSSVGTTWFFPMLLTTRALLFAPYSMLKWKPQVSKGKSSASTSSKITDQQASSANPPPKHIWQHEGRWPVTLIAALMIARLVLGLASRDKSAFLSAIHDSHAVSALGYDFLIGLMSLLVAATVQRL